MPLRRMGLLVLVIVLALYAWGQRSGRYQIARVGDHVFVVLDTATGEHWMYGPAALGNLRHVYIDGGGGIGVLDRIRP